MYSVIVGCSPQTGQSGSRRSATSVNVGLERVEEEQPADQRVADPERELQRLVRLERADDAGQHAEHAALGAARRELGRRRLREEAAVARALGGLKTVTWPSKRKIEPCTTGIRARRRRR